MQSLASNEAPGLCTVLSSKVLAADEPSSPAGRKIKAIQADSRLQSEGSDGSDTSSTSSGRAVCACISLPSQPSLHKAAIARAQAEDEAAAAHTAMLNRYRDEWQPSERTPRLRRVKMGLEWRLFWLKAVTGLDQLDTNEKVLVTLGYFAVIGLICGQLIKMLLTG